MSARAGKLFWNIQWNLPLHNWSVSEKSFVLSFYWQLFFCGCDFFWAIPILDSFALHPSDSSGKHRNTKLNHWHVSSVSRLEHNQCWVSNECPFLNLEIADAFKGFCSFPQRSILSENRNGSNQARKTKKYIWGKFFKVSKSCMLPPTRRFSSLSLSLLFLLIVSWHALEGQIPTPQIQVWRTRTTTAAIM